MKGYLEKGNSNSHGARPVHLIITMIKWIRTSRLSINNSLSWYAGAELALAQALPAIEFPYPAQVCLLLLLYSRDRSWKIREP